MLFIVFKATPVANLVINVYLIILAATRGAGVVGPFIFVK